MVKNLVDNLWKHIDLTNRCMNIKLNTGKTVYCFFGKWEPENGHPCEEILQILELADIADKCKNKNDYY